MAKAKKKKQGKQYHRQGNTLPPRMPAGTIAELAKQSKEAGKPVTKSVMEVAEETGVKQRLGYLLTTIYHIQSVQTLINGEVSNLMDNFGLNIKGLQAAMQAVEQAEDKFFETFSRIMVGCLDGTREDYWHDVDSLYGKIMRWEGLPAHWEIGQDQKLPKLTEQPEEEGKLLINGAYEQLKLDTTTLPPEAKGEPTVLYCVSKLDERNGTAEILKDNIKNKGLAAVTANRYAKANAGNIYVVYEKQTQMQEKVTLRPIKAAARPTQDSQPANENMVEIDITD